jgi:catechol 2,3-dioxygenase-like lactoylglutathione lyase family enzyme
VSDWTSGIAAITLFVEDLDRAKGFYARTFALPIHFEDGESAVFKFGGTMINLLASTAAPELIGPATVGRPESGSRFQFTLQVADVDATCTELTGRGVTLLNGPIDRPWGVRTASFQDPDGNIWELAH